MRHLINTGILCLLLFAGPLRASEIIPAPLKIEMLEGFYQMSSVPTYRFSSGCSNEAALMVSQLKKQFGITVRKVSGQQSDLQLILIKNNGLPAEGYRLEVNKSGISIIASSAAGIFYGIQSLMQLLRSDNGAMLKKVAVQRIIDQPRFFWRAFLLDEARHFKGVTVVKQLLDQMSALKMNRFQWHLTDDQGWRIAIEKYPLLTSIGAVRKASQTGGIGSTTFDNTEHKGYYTKTQLTDIVNYAAARHIQVIPEIEMPGHASAAIAAYPWLGVTGDQIEVPTTFGVFKTIFNVADPKVMTFLRDVLDEVSSIFPSKIIHIGGDEVLYDQWKNSTRVEKFMNEKKLKSPADLQLWFTNSISAYLQKRHLRMMGWNEITGSQLHEQQANAGYEEPQGELAPGTIVHFWKGDPKLIGETVSKGYQVVNSYHAFTYLDYDYTNISLEKAYSFDPVPETLDPGLRHKILGLGCQMWGEWIPTKEKMYDQVFPRIAAYAEIGWTAKENKDFNRFRSALSELVENWKTQGIISKHTVF